MNTLKSVFMMLMRCSISPGVVCLLIMFGSGAFAAPPIKGGQSGRPVVPGAGFDRSFELDGQTELERLCAEKTIKTLPLATVQTNALSLREISVHTEAGRYTVLLPLKQPQGEIRSLYWGADSIEETLTFMRLLEGEKITALKIETYAEEFRQDSDAPPTQKDYRDCPVDTMKGFLKPCKDCFIVEWVFGSSLIEPSR